MCFINAISSISYQNSFDRQGFTQNIQKLSPDASLVVPDFKKYIDLKILRRSSMIVRTSLACALNCLERSNDKLPEAIIAGTGFGCLKDTYNFLEHYITTKEDLLSPTSFIQSTHNTLAGQISLALKNHGYNMTHTQNNVSFERALEDAIMCLDEGMEYVLVGSADEYISFFENTILKKQNLSSGTTFLMLSKEQTLQSIAKIVSSQIIYKPGNVKTVAEAFLSCENIHLNSIKNVYYSFPFTANDNTNPLPDFGDKHYVSINDYSGAYATNSAFAIHMAADDLINQKSVRHLVFNHLNQENLGLTLLQSIQ